MCRISQKVTLQFLVDTWHVCVCSGALNGDTPESQSLQNAKMTTTTSVTKITHTQVQCKI